MLRHSAKLKSLQYPLLDIADTINQVELIAELIERVADSPDPPGHGENPDFIICYRGRRPRLLHPW